MIWFYNATVEMGEHGVETVRIFQRFSTLAEAYYRPIREAGSAVFNTMLAIREAVDRGEFDITELASGLEMPDNHTLVFWSEDSLEPGHELRFGLGDRRNVVNDQHPDVMAIREMVVTEVSEELGLTGVFSL